MTFDVIIIGGGPIGLACGLAAKNAQLSYLILEKGCLANSIFNYPLNMTFFSTPEKLEIGGVPFISNNPKPNRAEALEYYRRVALSHKLNIHLFEQVTDIRHELPESTIKTNKTSYQARNIILATGFYDIPALLNIPGENLPKVSHYYKEAHFYAGQRVVIVGANNSAVDAALEIYRKGGDVTMVIRKPAITERVKYWVKPDIENRIANGEIKAFFNANLLAIREHEVDVATPDGNLTFANDFVLALTGYRPDLSFLERIGVNLAKTEQRAPLYNPDTQESNLPHLFLAGVICGGLDTRAWFIENSIVHAERIIRRIAALS